MFLSPFFYLTARLAGRTIFAFIALKKGNFVFEEG